MAFHSVGSGIILPYIQCVPDISPAQVGLLVSQVRLVRTNRFAGNFYCRSLHSGDADLLPISLRGGMVHDTSVEIDLRA